MIINSNTLSKVNTQYREKRDKTRPVRLTDGTRDTVSKNGTVPSETGQVAPLVAKPNSKYSFKFLDQSLR